MTTTDLVPDPTAPTPPAAPTPKGHRPRRIIAWVLVVLFAILTPITLVSAWAVKTVTDTNRYVETLQPLAHDPVITNYVAAQATNKLFEQLNVQERISNVLPVKASFIAAPVTAQLKTFTDTQLKKLTSSTWFQKLWDRENRFTHATAVSILTGKNPPTVSKARSLVVNVSPTIIKGIDELDAKGITVFNPIRAQLKTNQLLSMQLVSPAQIKQAQTIFDLAITLRWVLLIGTPLIGLAAILVGIERRRTALRVALGGILGCLFLVVALTLGRAFFIDHAPNDGQLVAQHLIDEILRFLHRSLYITLGVFVLAALILWFVGDSTWAVALRRSIRSGSKQLGETAGQIRQSEATTKAIAWLGSAATFVERTLTPWRWAGVAIAALFLLTERTARAMFWTLVLLGVYQLCLWLIARWALRLRADATAAELEDPSTPVDASV